MKITFNTVSQFAHVGWGGFLTLAVLLFDPKWWVAAIVVASVAALKEFVWDKLTEDVTTQGNDFEDFAFFLVGIVIALFLNHLT